MGNTGGAFAADVRSEPAEGLTPLVVRRYAHPRWPERPLVRVIPEDVVAAEDARQDALGFDPVGEPTAVGFVARPVLGFPEWPLLQDPEHAAHATARMHDLDRIARLAASRPKEAVALAERAAAELDGTVPHFAPTFLEEAARTLVRHDRLAGARSLVARARRIERTHGLAVDEDRHCAVLLEFSRADALPAKELNEEAKRLAGVLPPLEAYRSFLDLATTRAEAGGAPTADLAKDVTRLGRAAGLTESAVHRELLETLLPLPSTADAPAGFWAALAGTVRAWGEEDPAVLDRILALPRTDVDLDAWLAVLEDMGALDRLAGGAPVEVVEEWLRPTLAVTRSPRHWFLRRKGASGGRVREVLHRLRLPEGHGLAPDLVVDDTDAILVDALLGAGARIDQVSPGRYRRRGELEVSGILADAEVDLPHLAALPLEHPVRGAVVAALRLPLRNGRTGGDEVVLPGADGRPGLCALMRQCLREHRETEEEAGRSVPWGVLKRAGDAVGPGPEVLPWPEAIGADGSPAAGDAPAAPEADLADGEEVPPAGPLQEPSAAASAAHTTPSAREGWWAPYPESIPLPEWLVKEFDARADKLDLNGAMGLAAPSFGAAAPHGPVSMALVAAAHLPLSAQAERRRVADALEGLAEEVRRLPEGEIPRDRTYPQWTPEMRQPRARAMLGLPSRAKERFVDHVDGPWRFESGEYDEQLSFTPCLVEDWAQERGRVDRIQGDPVEKDALASVLLCDGELDALLRDLRTRPEGDLPHADASPADPLVSAPETVAAAAAAHDLPEDAARYWLQLLALPGPKHTVVQRTNGWTAARRKKAAAPLIEAGLVVQGRRAKAGRDLFLPGGWAEGAGSALPMETWKRPLFLLHDTPRISPRLGHAVHLDPMSDVYPRVWERVAAGDVPALHEPTPGGTR